MRIARWLPALFLTLVLAAPASATHGGIHPKFRSQKVYFHCTGETPVQQVNWLAALGGPESYASWNTSPPAGSVSTGEGCGGADWGGASFDVLDPVFQGTFTGNLRDMTVILHDFVLNSERDPGTPVTLRIYGEVDSVPIFPGGAEGYAGRQVTVTPERLSSNFDVTDRFEFSITNVGFANEKKDAAGNVIDVETGGAALEDGNGSEEHTLKLYIGLEDVTGTAPQESGLEFFVWDTTEVPSGITFNPSGLAPATVQADLPDLS